MPSRRLIIVPACAALLAVLMPLVSNGQSTTPMDLQKSQVSVSDLTTSAAPPCGPTDVAPPGKPGQTAGQDTGPLHSPGPTGAISSTAKTDAGDCAAAAAQSSAAKTVQPAAHYDAASQPPAGSGEASSSASSQ